MPVKVFRTERGAGPVIVCDYCGERIENAKEANYEWDDDGLRPGEITVAFLLHKKCARQHQVEFGKHLDSMEMNVMLPYLAHNLMVDWDDAQRHAEFMSQDLG